MFRLMFCVLIALLLPACDQGGPQEANQTPAAPSPEAPEASATNDTETLKPAEGIPAPAAGLCQCIQLHCTPADAAQRRDDGRKDRSRLLPHVAACCDCDRLADGPRPSKRRATLGNGLRRENPPRRRGRHRQARSYCYVPRPVFGRGLARDQLLVRRESTTDGTARWPPRRRALEGGADLDAGRAADRARGGCV